MHCIFKEILIGVGKISANIFWSVAMIILIAVAAQILFGMIDIVAHVFFDVKVLNVYYLYFGGLGWVSLFGFLFYKAAIWIIHKFEDCKRHESKII